MAALIELLRSTGHYEHIRISGRMTERGLCVTGTLYWMMTTGYIGRSKIIMEECFKQARAALSAKYGDSVSGIELLNKCDVV